MKLFKKKDIYGIVNYTPLYRLTISFMLLITLLFVFSTLILFFEHDQDSGLNTIFQSLWYGHAVVTTIGFGDVTPVTVGGQLTTMTFSIFGIVLLVAMGNSLNDLLFGHTDTDVENRELRHFLKESILLDKENRKINKRILQELDAVKAKLAVLDTLA